MPLLFVLNFPKSAVFTASPLCQPNGDCWVFRACFFDNGERCSLRMFLSNPGNDKFFIRCDLVRFKSVNAIRKMKQGVRNLKVQFFCDGGFPTY